MSEEEGALARWSRRKLAARRATTEPPASGSGSAARATEPVELELPDIATLDVGSDFAAFMRPAVPAGLRREALRKLWRVNPIIGVPDGLDDYYITADFTDAATVVPDLQTLYRVGRGLLAEAEEVAAAADAPGDCAGPSGELPAREASGAGDADDTCSPPDTVLS